MKSLGDQLRRAIKDSGLSVYRIAKDSGVPLAVVQRFVSGERDIRLASADGLARYFQMKFTPPTMPKEKDD